MPSIPHPYTSSQRPPEQLLTLRIEWSSPVNNIKLHFQPPNHILFDFWAQISSDLSHNICGADADGKFHVRIPRVGSGETPSEVQHGEPRQFFCALCSGPEGLQITQQASGEVLAHWVSNWSLWGPKERNRQLFLLCLLYWGKTNSYSNAVTSFFGG